MVAEFNTRMGISPPCNCQPYQDQQTNEVKRARYRLILVRGSDLRWLNRDRIQEVKIGLASQHKWIPVQNLPFPEVILYACAADRLLVVISGILAGGILGFRIEPCCFPHPSSGP